MQLQTRQPMSAVSKLNMKHDASIRVEKKNKVVEVQQQDMTFGKIMHPGYADALKSLTEVKVRRARKDAEGNELDSDSDDDRSEVREHAFLHRTMYQSA